MYIIVTGGARFIVSHTLRAVLARGHRVTAGEQLRSSVDAARTRAVLGWSPTIGLEEGVRSITAWFRRALAGGGSPRP